MQDSYNSSYQFIALSSSNVKNVQIGGSVFFCHADKQSCWAWGALSQIPQPAVSEFQRAVSVADAVCSVAVINGGR